MTLAHSAVLRSLRQDLGQLVFFGPDDRGLHGRHLERGPRAVPGLR